MMLETVFQYRTLIGKCDLGCGLDWDDIEQVARIEHAFASDRHDGRRFRRESVWLEAVVRGDQINDNVEIVELGPGGLIIAGAPFIGRGEQIEIVVEDGEYSYRFRAQGKWLKDDGEDYRVGLAFIGMPIRLHKVALRTHETDVVDRMLLASAA
jgi:hypothetical protein